LFNFTTKGDKINRGFKSTIPAGKSEATH